MDWKSTMLGFAIVLGGFCYHEYQRLATGLAETQAQVASVAKASKETLDAMTQAIEKLSSRFKEQQQQQQEQPKVQQIVQSRIVMHSSLTCAPCRAWKATEQIKWEKSGWQVVEVVEDASSYTRNWPWFEIYENDAPVLVIDGPLTVDKFHAAKLRKQ